jgi:hypothetical protein
MRWFFSDHPQRWWHRKRFRNCLLQLGLTYLLLIVAFFVVYVILMGHHPADFGRDVAVATFGISAHMLAERSVRRLKRLSADHGDGSNSSKDA